MSLGLELWLDYSKHVVALLLKNILVSYEDVTRRLINTCLSAILWKCVINLENYVTNPVCPSFQCVLRLTHIYANLFKVLITIVFLIFE